MSVKRIKPRRSKLFASLQSDLEHELRRNSSKVAKADEPQIFEECDRFSDRFAVTVLWEKWNEIDMPERGEIILDAYKEARGEPEMAKISRALGLTRDEADRLGLHF